jgi:hypothetical protein
MKQVFRTSDGQEFTDAALAEKHEQMAKYYPTILAWAEKVYEGKQGMPKRAANAIIRWELDREEVIENFKAED